MSRSKLFIPLTKNLKKKKKQFWGREHPFQIMHFMRGPFLHVAPRIDENNGKGTAKDRYPQSKQFHTVELPTSLPKLLVCSNYYGGCGLTGLLISTGTAYLHMITGFYRSLQIHKKTLKKKKKRKRRETTEQNSQRIMSSVSVWINTYSAVDSTLFPHFAHTHFRNLKETLCKFFGFIIVFWVTPWIY